MSDWCGADPLRSVSAWSLREDPADPPQVWSEYKQRMEFSSQGKRVLLGAMLFLFAGMLMFKVTDAPFTPYRGDVALYVNEGLLRMSVVTLIVVILLVLDVMRMTSTMVHKLVSTQLSCRKPADDLTKLQLIARLTSRIESFVYYPAVLLTLMLLARAEYLDNWDFPIGLAAVIGISVLYVIASAICLRRAAEEARRSVVRELTDRRFAGAPALSPANARLLLERIGAIREGAFRPYPEHPVFRAFALPSGAYGGVLLLELLASYF